MILPKHMLVFGYKTYVGVGSPIDYAESRERDELRISNSECFLLGAAGIPPFAVGGGAELQEWISGKAFVNAPLFDLSSL